MEKKVTSSHPGSFTRKQASMLLTIIALLLWSHSIIYAKLEIGYFGLIHGLPVTFFPALAFLTVASAILWTANENHSRLLCLQLLVSVSALWLIPVITGGSPPFTDHMYRNLGLIDQILSQSHFGSNISWYYHWPGTLIVSAMTLKIGSINLEPILGFLPLLTQLLYLPPLYVFLKNTLGETRRNYCWAGCWLFYLAQWLGQDYLGPQSMSFFLLLTLLALVTRPAVWEKNSRSFAWLSMIVLIFAALPITHFLTALAALSILGVLCLIKWSKRVVPVVLLCLLVVVIWDLTGGVSYVMTPFSRPLVYTPAQPGTAPAQPGTAPAQSGILVLNPETITQREVTGHLSGSESHIAVAKVRLLFSSIIALLGMAGAILFLMFRKSFSLAVMVLVVTLSPLVLLPLSQGYAEELLHRLYLFALPGMAFFGAMLLDMKSKIPVIVLCVLMLAGFPLHIISHYGNQEIDYFPSGQAAGLKFFNHTTRRGYIAGAWPLGYGLFRYTETFYEQLRWSGNELDTRASAKMPHYIAIDYQDRAWYEWYVGDKQFIENFEGSMDSAVNCNLIYDNPAFSLYMCEGPNNPPKN